MFVFINIQLFFVLAFLKQSWCFCEESYVIICDDLSDLKVNDTWTWRHVLIGSSEYKHDPPSKTLDDNAIFSLNHVKSLTILNQVKLVKPLGLSKSSFRDLEYLNLYDNDVGTIEDFTFEGFPKLRDLYLENNQIQHLGRAVFKNTSLEILSLSRNRLGSITTCFLQSKIKWLKINQNQLTFIKARAFPSSLERLEMDHNLLRTLDENVFEGLSNLKELSMKHNLLTSLPNILPLRKVHYLHFAYNKIERIDYSFNQHHENLEFLDLGSNRIRNISLDGISDVKSAPIVVLTFNRLHDLKFNHPEKKTDLVLFGNPWICDCLFNIEKIVKEHHHMTSCQEDSGNVFRKGNFPLCIEHGKCGENKDVDDELVNEFIKSVSKVDFKDPCNFRL